MNIATVCFRAAIASVFLGIAFVSPAKADQPELGIVQQFTSGDTACYVDLIDTDGQPFTALANFEICDQNLIGQTVQLSYESAKVIAASCQGNPACSDTETVQLITRAEVIEPPTVGIVQNMVAGDRACYVDISDDQGNTTTQYADFAICEQDLIGKPVELTYEPGNITAMTCQGDPACNVSDTVMLITHATALEPADF